MAFPLEKSFDLDDDQLYSGDSALALCGRGEEARRDLAKLSGTVQNDILKEYIARGTYIYPVRPAMRIVTDIFRWCRDALPRWNTISISGYHIREAGSTACRKCVHAGGRDCVCASGAGCRAGHDDFAPQLSFFFNAHKRFAGRDCQIPGSAANCGRA